MRGIIVGKRTFAGCIVVAKRKKKPSCSNEASTLSGGRIAGDRAEGFIDSKGGWCIGKGGGFADDYREGVLEVEFEWTKNGNCSEGSLRCAYHLKKNSYRLFFFEGERARGKRGFSTSGKKSFGKEEMCVNIETAILV